jgi:hypothetical protein
VVKRIDAIFHIASFRSPALTECQRGSIESLPANY